MLIEIKSLMASRSSLEKPRGVLHRAHLGAGTVTQAELVHGGNLLARVDAFASEKGLTRSVVLHLTLQQILETGVTMSAS